MSALVHSATRMDDTLMSEEGYEPDIEGRRLDVA
jgi:hypothetical protein